MPTALLNDVELYYEAEGNGEPVLLVPPSWWPSDTWKVGVVPALAKRYRTIIFDCRGTGRSGKPTNGYSVSQFAEDAAALVEHLKIPHCHAVGFALGGQIVQALAIARPDLVATLTMAAAGPGSKTLSGGPRDLSPEAAREIRDMGFEQMHPLAFHHVLLKSRRTATWCGIVHGMFSLSRPANSRPTSPEPVKIAS